MSENVQMIFALVSNRSNLTFVILDLFFAESYVNNHR
jgi:hypothetical protein